LLAGAGVGIYILTRPTQKASGPIDTALKVGGAVFGAIGEVGGDLAQGVTKLVMPGVKPIAGVVTSALKLPATLPKVPGMAYDAGSTAVSTVEKGASTIVGTVTTGASKLLGSAVGWF